MSVREVERGERKEKGGEKILRKMSEGRWTGGEESLEMEVWDFLSSSKDEQKEFILP